MFEFEAPKGQRVHRYFMSIEAEKPDGERMWWDPIDRKWDTMENLQGKCFQSWVPCHTLRAFKSHIRRYGKELEGCSVRLVNRFVGYDIWKEL